LSLIPYLPHDHDQPRELVEAIRARRGGKLLNLDRMLLHSPPLAAGWNAHLRAVRSELAVPAQLRELAICAVAVLNRADYEFAQHAPHYVKAGGSESELQRLRSLGTAAFDPSAFSPQHRVTIALAKEMTRDIEVRPATLQAARSALASDRELVELVGVIATYNMVSRFLVALGVEAE
jgi:alkylhydroperoxidase family enzyme